MGQTSSSNSVSSSSSLSSSDTPNLPPDYSQYPHNPSSSFTSSSHAATEDDVPTPPPSDGYRWRKYGQKSVKGSAYARNYYKCTYPGCTVKKQVDKINSNGKVVDQVLCKGEHCHGPPQITRINAHDQQTFRNSVITESLAHTEIMVKHEESPSRSSYGQARSSGGATSNASTSSTSSRSKVSTSGSQMADPYSMMYHLPAHSYDSHQHNLSHPNGAPHTSYNAMNHEHSVNSFSSPNFIPKISNAHSGTNNSASYENSNSDKSTNNNNNVTAEGTGEGSKFSTDVNSNTNSSSGGGNTSTALITTSSNTTNSTSSQPQGSQPVTTVTSPRLVIETNTSVDCLDDGYHWRKYGQKTVKGSPFPRSYYKCTEKGCSVKKQVEQNGTSIVNTYEGTHTHLAPAFDDSSELSKKRRLRRSEGQDSSNPAFKRMHKSLDDDVKASHSPNNTPQNYSHTPMPIGSMGSILQHTSHLQTMNYLPPTLPSVTPQPATVAPVYSNQPDSNNFASLASLSGPKVRVDTTPALAPLNSFSHSTLPPTPTPAPSNASPKFSAPTPTPTHASDS